MKCRRTSFLSAFRFGRENVNVVNDVNVYVNVPIARNPNVYAGC